jgi:hypothetical protein
MAEQLYLSYQLHGFQVLNMLRFWEKTIRLFPYSKLARWPPTLRIHAISYEEPLLREQAFETPPDLDAIAQVAHENLAGDCAYVLDAHWDIWQFGSEWSVQPSRVSLACFGPDFESETDDHLRIEFGLDTNFLPQPQVPNSAAMVQSNLKSLLHLVHQIDDALPVEQRRLWTESGGNFAERLQALL